MESGDRNGALHHCVQPVILQMQADKHMYRYQFVFIYKSFPTQGHKQSYETLEREDPENSSPTSSF